LLQSIGASSRRRTGTIMTSEELQQDILERLAPLPVASRRLFGGCGLYLEGAFFGVIVDGRLYFRTDDDSRAAFVERGMTALQPRWRVRGPKTVDRNFEVPAAILGDTEALRTWALRAGATRRR
jgi:DNA transformation protein